MNREEKIKLGMVIGIYLAVAILLFLSIVLIKNIKEIKSDPINYGIEKMDYNYCTCYSEHGFMNYGSVKNTLTQNLSVSFQS